MVAADINESYIVVLIICKQILAGRDRGKLDVCPSGNCSKHLLFASTSPQQLIDYIPHPPPLKLTVYPKGRSCELLLSTSD